MWWQSPGFRTQNQGGGATGGGVSTVFDRPSWQKVQVKSINSGSIDGRVVPDVAALAGPPLYDLVFITKRQPNGGTSASAPLWAALIARVNASLPQAKQQRFLTPLLYQNGSKGQPVGKGASRDITSGNNASHPDPGVGYAAKVGFDAASGWGVPDGAEAAECAQGGVKSGATGQIEDCSTCEQTRPAGAACRRTSCSNIHRSIVFENAFWTPRRCVLYDNPMCKVGRTPAFNNGFGIVRALCGHRR